MSNIKPLISEDKKNEHKTVWFDAYDDIFAKSTNLKAAIQVAFQEQGNSRDFDCWILEKIRDDILKFAELMEEIEGKFQDGIDLRNIKNQPYTN